MKLDMLQNNKEGKEGECDEYESKFRHEKEQEIQVLAFKLGLGGQIQTCSEIWSGRKQRGVNSDEICRSATKL